MDALAPSRVSRSCSATDEAEEKKTAKYTEISDRGYIFQPLVFDTQGQCGSSTARFINILGKTLSNQTGEPRSKSFFVQSITSIIQRYNAACILGTLGDDSNVDDVYTLL